MTVANTPKVEKERICYIDLLRIIACFFVIVNHTNSQIFQNRAPTLTWFVSLTYFFFSKAAVPVFIMISGYTMLSRQETHEKAFSRFFPFFHVLLFSPGVYILYNDAFCENPRHFQHS